MHNTFLPQTEHWICRLTAGVRALHHIALAEQATLGVPASCQHAAYVPHGLEHLTARRHAPARLTRYNAAAQIAFAGGVAGAGLRQLKRRGLRPDLLHFHFGDVAWLWRRLITRLEAPAVVSFYGYDYASLPRRSPTWRARLSWVLAKADLLVAEGPHAAERLVSLGADAHRVAIVNLGTDVPPAPVAGPRIPGARFLQLATLTEKKAQTLTIRAFEQVAADYPDATLTLVGGVGQAAYAKTVREAAAASPYAPRITVLDPIPTAELPRILSAYDYFLQPSVTAADGDSEGGAPVALLDAQAAGLPVLVSDHCDLPYVRADLGWNDPAAAGDAAAFGALMRVGLGRTPIERRRDRTASRAFVEANFAVERWSRELERLYLNLL